MIKRGSPEFFRDVHSLAMRTTALAVSKRVARFRHRAKTCAHTVGTSCNARFELGQCCRMCADARSCTTAANWANKRDMQGGPKAGKP